MAYFLNHTNKKCYVLDEYDDDTRLYEPSEYWVLNLLTIVLKDQEKSYLVLECPSYSEVTTNSKKNDCIWSVPFMAYLLKKDGTLRYDTVGDIKTFYAEKTKNKSGIIKELESYRFYHMGISHFNKHRGRSYIEYKLSPRQPDRWKCYFINEYYITDIDHLGLLNLADPEGLHSYQYLPLENGKYDSTTSEINFMDKKLSSNITNMIVNSWVNLMKYQNEVSEDLLKYTQSGLVFKIDVIGFTNVYHRIIDEFKAFNHSGKEYGADFVALLAELFEEKIKENQINQYSIEGDGVTGTIIVEQGNCTAMLERIYHIVTELQNEINSLISNLKTTINIRCVIAYGTFVYGKLAGLDSLQKSVSGDIMITTARMDQCLKEYLIENPTDCNIFGVSGQFLANCFSNIKRNPMREIGFYNNYRNTNVEMHIFVKGDDDHD